MSAWNPDAVNWPDPPEEDGTDENVKALYAAKLAVRTKRAEAEIERAKAETDAEITTKTAYEQAILDVAKDSVGRGQAAAETLQKAASAIMALYTGGLALAFSVADHPLPLRGMIPAILLGVAVVASTVYLAYLTTPHDVAGVSPHSSPREMTSRRINQFIIWTRSRTLARSYWLHVSILALAASLAFMPAPFVTISKKKPAAPAAKTAAASAPTTHWPPVPAASGAGIALQKILYSAKVAEAAARRSAEVKAATAGAAAAAAGTSSDSWWWIAFAVALALCLGAPGIVEVVASNARSLEAR